MNTPQQRRTTHCSATNSFDKEIEHVDGLQENQQRELQNGSLKIGEDRQAVTQTNQTWSTVILT
jgi:hypothetical protein